MEMDTKYTFVALPESNYVGLQDKNIREFFAKW